VISLILIKLKFWINSQIC